MPKMRSPPMPDSRQGSVRYLALSFAMISTSLNLPPLRIKSTDPSELSMAMKCSKSLANMLLSLLLLQVQPLRNTEYGFQLVPYLKTFFRGHHPIYAIHLNTLFLPGMMVCNQVILLPAIQAGCVSSVVCQAITFINALRS